MPQSARARLMTVLQLSITKSARNLYDTVHQFILDMKLVLINPALFDPTVNDLLPLAISGIRSLFEDYLLAMTAASKSDMISDAQGMSIVANCYFLAEDLFPRIKKQLAGKVDMKRGTLPFRLILAVVTYWRSGLSNIAAFHDQLGKFYKAQRDFFFQQRGDVWVRDVIRWPANASAWYKEGGNSDAPVETPSPGFINFGKYLETLQSLAKSCLDVSHLCCLSPFGILIRRRKGGSTENAIPRRCRSSVASTFGCAMVTRPREIRHPSLPAARSGHDVHENG